MLDGLFETTEYYNFPSFEVALYSLLLSFVLSAVIGLTYRLTFSGPKFPIDFFQAIVLSSMVSSMVIMAVGNNVAAGFGIIGAIAIIRFRTLIRNPRNIIFIFAALSVGIATGVYGYSIALAGTLIFCAVALILHYSPIEGKHKQVFQLQFISADPSAIDRLLSFLDSKSIRHHRLQSRQVAESESLRFSYRITLSDQLDTDVLFSEIISHEGISDVRLSISEDVEL